MSPIHTPLTIERAAAYIASGHLVAKGYVIHDVHSETDRGVIAVVATDRARHGGALVFCALRVTDRFNPHTPPIGTRNTAAARTLRQMSVEWVNSAGAFHDATELRWDALGITFIRDGCTYFEHVEAVF